MTQHTDLLNQISQDEIISLCQTLVRFKTVNPPGDEHVAAEYIANLLREVGFQVELVPLAENRSSVLARLKGSGELPALFFNGHLDVVPPGEGVWAHDPFGADVVDGKLWGRGSADMKGGLAAILTMGKLIAKAQLRLRGDLIITATADEEAGMTGGQRLATRTDLGDIQAAIIAEPTNLHIGLAERGVLWLQLETLGKTAHGSTPYLGRNAITMMITLLTEFEQLAIPFSPHPILGDFTRSVNTITGGVKTNVVPDHCTVTIDMRTVPDQDHYTIIRMVEHLIAQLSQHDPLFKASVKKLQEHPSVETSPNEPVVKQFERAIAQATGREATQAIVRFATEAAIYVPVLGVPAIICGPGDPALAHQPNEYVEIEQLVQATRIYTLSVANLLA